MEQPVAGLIVHIGTMTRGTLHVGETVTLKVDDTRRGDIRRHHTATHILHKELRAHLGTHVTQQGSLVAPDRLRFDFSHGEAVDSETLARIEAAINGAILGNQQVTATHMGQKEAISNGAMALFGEKYGDVVRTIRIGDLDAPYSFELCGGLHVGETGEIGSFRFTSEGAVAAGIRRVEAVTGRFANDYISERLSTLNRIAGQLNATPTEAEARLEKLLAEHKSLQKELAQLQRQLARGQFDELLAQVQQVNGVNVLTAQVDVADVDAMREMADWYRDKVGSGVAVLAMVNGNRPVFIATVTNDLIKRGLKAGDIVREVAKVVGGGGGGRPNMAQAGGKDASKVPAALAIVPGLVAAVVKE